MIVEDYRWVAEILDNGGKTIEQVELNLDFQPISESVFFEGVREHSLPLVKNSGETLVEPVWDGNTKAPVVQDIQVTVTISKSSFSRRVNMVGHGIVKEHARRISTDLVKKGKLTAGERFNYQLLAFPKPKDSNSRMDGDFELNVVEEPITIRKTKNLHKLLECASRQSKSVWHDQDLTVFIPERVLNDARLLGEKAGETESGGILIGELCMDQENLFAVANAFIEAKYTEADSTSLSFTPNTWADVENAKNLRCKNEQIIGWAHTYPAFSWCKNCDDVRRSVCPLQKPFFSDSDVNVQRTVFSSAFMVAILITFLSKKTEINMYGWREGQVVPRGYYKIPDEAMYST